MLIDGHSVAYRAFFALPVENFSTQTGQHTNGVFGFTSMLINVLRDEAPTHLGVAFDVSRQTFRSEIYTEYKANRSKTPDEFKGQLDLVKEVLKALNIAYVEKPGFEADDVIGTLATQAEAQGFDVLDLHRRPGRVPAGHRPGHRALPAQGRFGPGPDDPRGGGGEVLRDPGALSRPGRPGRASPATTCPACPGSGPKTAAKWLETYDGLENLAAHAGELKGKAAEAFQERIEDVLRNRQINALVLDLELPVTIDDLERRPWNREATHQLFDGLEFRVLRDRLLEALPNEDEVVPEGGFELTRRRLRAGRAGRLAGRARHRRAHRGRRDRPLGLGHRRRHARWRWRPPTARRYVDVTELTAPTRTRWPTGWPTPTGTRRCTTPRARCWRSGPAAGISPV